MDFFWRIVIRTVPLGIILSLAACTAPSDLPPPSCSSEGILIVPTATRQLDPNLLNPPAPPNGGDGTTYCPTPIAETTPITEFPEQFITTNVVNLSLDSVHQDLAAIAVGDDMLAVAWITNNDIYVALSRGGNHFQVRRVDSGNSVSMVFSTLNRLHVTYEKDGVIYYRAADQGDHPANPDFLATVDNGHHPQITLDSRNWAHILYEADDGTIGHATHLYQFFWFTETIGSGHTPTVFTFDPGQRQPEPGGQDFALSYLSNDQIHLLVYGMTLLLQPGWVAVANIPIVEMPMGKVVLDTAVHPDGSSQLVAAWAVHTPSPQPPLPLYAQPTYDAANPLYPDQLANPQHIYQGLNAVRWYSQGSPFAAGLWQTVAIPDPDSSLTFSAQGLAETAVAVDFPLRIGVDPTGSNNPASSDIIWSDPATPTDFNEFTMNIPADGPTATVFLEATLNTPNVLGLVAWDAASLQNGNPSTNLLSNGDFEGPFVSQSTLTVPDGWTAYYQDGGNSAPGGRDVYTVYAARSEDGGLTWSAPMPVTENREATGSTTGAFRAQVYPLISTKTEEPSVSFITIYETGDPPLNTDFLRFGRPTLTMCDLNLTNCTDSPGLPLLPRNAIRPTTALFVAPDPLNSDRALLVWDGLQTDVTRKDVYSTYLVLR